MADPDAGGEDAVIPQPTEEERETETVNDEITPKGGAGPEPKSDGPDVSVRLDAIEKELAALKAMLDTLGFDDASVGDEGSEPGSPVESIEDLFD